MSKWTFMILFALLHSVTSYRFHCLHFNETSCQCDTDAALIDCNSLGLTNLPPLKTRLRGYTLWTLTANHLIGPLPKERYVLTYFPHLRAMDLRGNPKLDCEEIVKEYERIKVYSDCTEGNTSPDSQEANGPPPCEDLWCRVGRDVNGAWMKTYAHLNYAWQKTKQQWYSLKEWWCPSKPREKQGLFEITR